mmetsp:Transcript_63987/g.152606  ORF Transcript_63987/g.152606 Transcript_63987/m.152606 type:complete len:253 (-) Transcript_63987:363-1121(-)
MSRSHAGQPAGAGAQGASTGSVLTLVFLGAGSTLERSWPPRERLAGAWCERSMCSGVYSSPSTIPRSSTICCSVSRNCAGHVSPALYAVSAARKRGLAASGSTPRSRRIVEITNPFLRCASVPGNLPYCLRVASIRLRVMSLAVMSIASSGLSLTSTIAPAGAASTTPGEEEGERAEGSEEMRIAGMAPTASLPHARCAGAGVASWKSEALNDARELHRCSAAMLSLKTTVKVADWCEIERRNDRKSPGVNL